ncbi:MAG: ABC transporter permease [Eubacteriales bacterium]|nr:ABC transporter permease [Eubacteriales bacterium]
MMSHILKYRLKCFFRDRETLFWTLMFPLILAVLFNLAFSNLYKTEAFKDIKIAVADSAEYREDVIFGSVLEAVSFIDKGNGSAEGDVENGESESGGNNHFFHTLIAENRQEAQALLDNNSIYGYVYYDGGPKLAVRYSGIRQTIIKSFVDEYLQKSYAVNDIISRNISAGGQAGPYGTEDLYLKVASIASERAVFIKDVPASTEAPVSTVIYFYSLIAMAALYGGFWGIRAVSESQADISYQGARVSVAPVHRFKQLICDLTSAMIIQYAEILVLMIFIRYVLGYEFGSQTGLVLIAAFAACLMGISYGAFIGAAVRKSEGIRIAILIGTSMFMSFLSGMMSIEIKYLVVRAFPPVAWLNPSNLVSDAFYTLYYYDTYEKYYTCVAGLFAYAAVFGLSSWLLMRRKKYAAI